MRRLISGSGFFKRRSGRSTALVKWQWLGLLALLAYLNVYQASSPCNAFRVNPGSLEVDPRDPKPGQMAVLDNRGRIEVSQSCKGQLLVTYNAARNVVEVSPLVSEATKPILCALIVFDIYTDKDGKEVRDRTYPFVQILSKPIKVLGPSRKTASVWVLDPGPVSFDIEGGVKPYKVKKSTPPGIIQATTAAADGSFTVQTFKPGFTTLEIQDSGFPPLIHFVKFQVRAP